MKLDDHYEKRLKEKQEKKDKEIQAFLNEVLEVSDLSQESMKSISHVYQAQESDSMMISKFQPMDILRVQEDEVGQKESGEDQGEDENEIKFARVDIESFFKP